MGNADTCQLLIAAGPGAPGAAALLDRAVAAVGDGGRARVLLTGPGLAWAREPALARLAGREGVEVVLCSRSARERGLDPDAIPPWVRWSSLIRWLLDRPADAPLWTVLP